MALGLALFGWLTLADNPLGGEPVVVIALDKPPGAGAAGDATAPAGMRNSVNATDKGTSVAGSEGPEQKRGTKDAAGAADGAATGRSDRAGRLVTAPVKAVSERGPNGLLPRIAKDGRRPADVYARPLRLTPGAAGATARVAILIGGMGLSSAGTAQAVTKLPEEVTLAFAPYAKGLERWVAKARRNGHEVMLQVPMEPFDYPDNDPGPYTLLTDLNESDNLRRLTWLLSRFSGYTGVVNYMGAKFTASPGPLRTILTQLKRRGLLFLDDGSSPRSRTEATAQSVGLDAAVGDVVIDIVQSGEAIDDALKQAEMIALRKGRVIATGSGLPITVERIREWAQSLKDKGIVLVPVSALIMAKKNR